MPQFAPVILKGYLDAPTTFSPGDIVQGVATLLNRSGVPIADQKVTFSSTQTPTGRQKVAIKFAVPIVQDATVNGVTRPTVVRTAYAELNFSFDGASSVSERAAMRNYVSTLLNQNFGYDLVDNLLKYY